MKHIYLAFIVLFFIACQKDKKNNPPSKPTSIIKSVGNSYKYADLLFPKFTSDGNMLAVLVQSNGIGDLVKLAPDGQIIWTSVLGNESFRRGKINEFSDDIYLIMSVTNVYFVNKTGSILKKLPLAVQDGHQKGNNIFLANMNYCYQLDVNYTITDSFPNTHKPKEGIGNYPLLFKNDGRIQYFFKDSIKSSEIRIITCATNNTFLDSTAIDYGGSVETFHTASDNVILTQGFWGNTGAASFHYELYMYNSGNSLIKVSPHQHSSNFFCGRFTEKSDHSLMYITSKVLFLTSNEAQTVFQLNKISSSQSTVAIPNDIIMDTTTSKYGIQDCSNIIGLVSEPGTDNVYVMTKYGTSLYPGPGLLKINGNSEVIPF